MAGTLITTTKRGAMRPLAVQGIFATDCYPQLRNLLERRLGPEHARLLAEPVHDPARENVDWYSGAEGTPTPLSALPPEQADAARARIGRMAAEIRAAAEEISKGPDSRRALSGQLLLLSLQHPHEDDLWLAGEQPIVCCWGFAPGALGAQPEDLARLGPAGPAPEPVAAAAPVPIASEPAPRPVAAAAPVPITAEPEPKPVAAAEPAPIAAEPEPEPEPVAAAAPVPIAAEPGCLAWLLPFLLLLALLWLLLCRFGLMPTAGLCPPPRFGENTGRLKEEREKGAQVLRDIENLRADLSRRAERCVPPPPPPPPPQEPAPPPPPEVEPPLVEPFLGASTPPPPPPPKEPPKPEPKPAPQKDAPLTIPDDAKEKNDLSFLEGCWRCETGLVNARTRQPVIVEYCFDKNGNGRRSVNERNGAACNGQARAGFDQGGKLRIDADNAPCPGGNGYVPQTVECVGDADATHCKGQEHYGGGDGSGGPRGRIFGSKDSNKWDAKFYRK